jgi:hypothetical protein
MPRIGHVHLSIAGLITTDISSMLTNKTATSNEKPKSKEMINQKSELAINNKSKENDSAVQQAKIDEVLNELNWEAAGDSAALEKRLHDEIVALETVILHFLSLYLNLI